MAATSQFSLFDLIAPAYGWFFAYQVRNYRQVVAENAALFAEIRKSVV